MLYLIFSNLLPYVLSGRLFDKEVMKKAAAAGMSFNDAEKKVSNIYSFLFFALIAYSFFLPLKLGIVWFYVGFIIYLLGVLSRQWLCWISLLLQWTRPSIKASTVFRETNVLWCILDFRRHRYLMCFMGFLASYSCIPDSVAYCCSCRRTVLYPKVWRYISRLPE